MLKKKFLEKMTILFMASMVFSWSLWAETEGFNRNSGTTLPGTPDAYKDGFVNHDWSPSGINSNSQNSDTAVSSLKVKNFANNDLKILGENIEEALPNFDKGLETALTTTAINSLLTMTKELSAGLLLAVNPLIQSELGKSAAGSFNELVNDSLISKFDKLKFDTIGVTKGFLLDMVKNIAIETISEVATKQTSSPAIGGAVWLTLKHADIYATSGNLAVVAYKEAMLAGEVWYKVGEEAVNAYNETKALKKSIKNGVKIDIEYIKVMGAVKYAEAKTKEEKNKIAEQIYLDIQNLINNSNILNNSDKFSLMDEMDDIRPYLEQMDAKINPNKKNLSKLEKTDKEIKNKVKEINDDSQTLTQKEKELEQLKNNSGQNQIDQSKMANIQKAQDIVNKNAGKPWSAWSQSDKIAMGIIARNLGVATGQAGIEGKGHFFEALFRFKGTDYLIEKYATSYVSIDYSDLENEINDLIEQINTKKEELAKLEAEKNDAMKSIVDTTSDFNDDQKETLAQTFKSTISSPQDWKGVTVAHIFDKTTGAVVSTTSAIHQALGSDIADAGILEEVDSNLKITKGVYLETHGVTYNNVDEEASVNISSSQTIKNLSNSNSDGLDVETIGYKDDYLAWGTWGDETITFSGSSDRAIRSSYWIAGKMTDNSEIPQTGSATYTGDLIGYNTTSNQAIDGTVSITANFGTSSMTGSMIVNNADTSNFANAHLDSVSINTKSYGTEFHGNLIGTDISSGKIGGAFYGANAKSIGGAWSIDKTDSSHAAGVFNASK